MERVVAWVSTFAAAAAALAGCDSRPRPWEGQDPSGMPPPAPPPRTPQDGGSLLSEAPTLLEAAEDAAPPAAPVPPVRVGGPWIRCFGNFRPSGEPLKDVTRLALLCGPSNGMVRASDSAAEGSVTAGQPPTSFPLEVSQGECYRIFAVAEPTVEDLDVVVRSSRGAPIAADHGDDPWPIVQPDRPFCTLEADKLTVEVSARRGAGKFAAEAWKLPAVTAKPR